MRRAFVVAGVVAAVAGCGLSVTGIGPTDGEPLTDGGAVADAATAPADASAVDTGPADAGCQPEGTLLCCGGDVCPDGTAACEAGRCVAKLAVTATIDGYDDLVLQGGAVWWFHVSNDDPTNTKLNGTSYAPTFPPNGLPNHGCNCDATSKTGLAPAAARHPQIPAITKTAGRGTVSVIDGGSAENGYEISVQFADPQSSTDDYAATITYETR